jgi:hypothetical protein
VNTHSARNRWIDSMDYLLMTNHCKSFQVQTGLGHFLSPHHLTSSTKCSFYSENTGHKINSKQSWRNTHFKTHPFAKKGVNFVVFEARKCARLRVNIFYKQNLLTCISLCIYTICEIGIKYIFSVDILNCCENKRGCRRDNL